MTRAKLVTIIVGVVLLLVVGAVYLLWPTSSTTSASSAAPTAGSDGTDPDAASPDAAGTGDHPRDGTGFTKDPCSLLTDDEASQAVGHAVKALPSSDDKMCEWTVGGESSFDSLYVNYQTGPFSRDVIRDLKRPKPGAQLEREDIGDGALLNAPQGEINVVVGDSVFRIGSSGAGSPLPGETLVGLARLVQPRVR